MPLSAGTRLGPYEIVAPLGRGRAASSTAAPRPLFKLPTLLIPTQIAPDGKLLVFFADMGERPASTYSSFR